MLSFGESEMAKALCWVVQIMHRNSGEQTSVSYSSCREHLITH